MTPRTKEIRVKELTSLMTACIIGNFNSVKHLVQVAKKRLNPEQFKLFINVKTTQEFGGNNALLYACSSTNSNFMIVNYLITEAGADKDSINDYNLSCLIISTKRAQHNIIDLLLKYNADICYTDRKGCNALHVASHAGHTDIVHMLLLYWSRDRLNKKKQKVKDGTAESVADDDSLCIVYGDKEHFTID